MISLIFYYFSRASDDVHLRLMHGITDEASAPVAFVNVGFCEK
jgi:hypothetical protein